MKTKMKSNVREYGVSIVFAILVGASGVSQVDAASPLMSHQQPRPEPTQKAKVSDGKEKKTAGADMKKEGGGGSVGSGNDGLILSDTGLACDHCPEKPSTSEMTFDRAEKVFDRGVLPTTEELSGEWRLVLLTIHPEVADTSANPFGSLMGEDVNGIKNHDGSAAFSLRFQKIKSDWDGMVKLSADFENLGSRRLSQRSIEVRIRDREVCFSQYGYNEHGFEDRSIWATYECRLVNSSSDRMLCGVTLGWDGTITDPRWLKPVGYLGYRKVK